MPTSRADQILLWTAGRSFWPISTRRATRQPSSCRNLATTSRATNRPTSLTPPLTPTSLWLDLCSLNLGDCLIPGSDGKSAARPRSLADLPPRFYNKIPHSAFEITRYSNVSSCTPLTCRNPALELSHRSPRSRRVVALTFDQRPHRTAFLGEVITAEQALLHVTYHCSSCSWIGPNLKYEFSSSQSLPNRGWGKTVRMSILVRERVCRDLQRHPKRIWQQFVQGRRCSRSNSRRCPAPGKEQAGNVLGVQEEVPPPPKRGQTYFLMANEDVKAERARLSAYLYVSIL